MSEKKGNQVVADALMAYNAFKAVRTALIDSDTTWTKRQEGHADHVAHVKEEIAKQKTATTPDRYAELVTELNKTETHFKILDEGHKLQREEVRCTYKTAVNALKIHRIKILSLFEDMFLTMRSDQKVAVWLIEDATTVIEKDENYWLVRAKAIDSALVDNGLAQNQSDRIVSVTVDQKVYTVTGALKDYWPASGDDASTIPAFIPMLPPSFATREQQQELIKMLFSSRFHTFS